MMTQSTLLMLMDWRPVCDIKFSRHTTNIPTLTTGQATDLSVKILRRGLHLAHEVGRKLFVMLRRDAHLELRQLAGVTALDHLPDLVQPRNNGSLFMRHAQFQKFTRRTQLRPDFRE